MLYHEFLKTAPVGELRANAEKMHALGKSLAGVSGDLRAKHPNIPQHQWPVSDRLTYAKYAMRLRQLAEDRKYLLDSIELRRAKG